MGYKLSFFVLLLCSLLRGFSQNIGIGTATPNASAKLDIFATDKGLLLPRVALTATNIASPVTSPVTALLIFNTATAGAGATAVSPGFYYWDSAQWLRFSTTDNDMQDLALTGNILSLTNDATTVDLSPYLDNTDAQSLAFNVGTGDLSISGGNTVNIPQVTDTDDQTLTLNAGTNVLAIDNGNNVNLTPYLDNTDGQTLSFNSGTGVLNISGGNSVTLPVVTDTDDQTLSISGNQLTIIDGNTVTLPDNDIQDLSLTGNTLSLTNDATTVNLSPYLDNTDGQTLSYNNLTGTLNISSGNSVIIPVVTDTDDQTLSYNAVTGDLTIVDGNTVSLAPLLNNDWHILGNSSTNPAINFVGTTNNVALRFRTNNILSGEIDPINGGTFFGYQTGLVNAGIRNTFLGANVGTTNGAGVENTAVGYNSLTSNTSGNGNTAVGAGSMQANSTGYFNTAVGTGALIVNTSGYSNVANGLFSMVSNTTGSENTAVGFGSLSSNLAGIDNVALGYSALAANSTNRNVAIGAFSMLSSVTGQENVAIGFFAMRNANGGGQNVGIGPNALRENTASGNVAIGNNAMLVNTSGTANVAIGGGAMQLSILSTSNTAVGMNTLQNNVTAGRNVAIGASALQNQSFSNGGVIWSSNNIAIGYQALINNQPTSTVNGINNVAIGSNALDANTTGNRNIAIGTDAIGALTSGTSNVAVGRDALSSITTTSQNTAIGTEALKLNVGGINNTAIGHQALGNGNAGGENTAVGMNALFNNTVSTNTAVGKEAGFSTLTGAGNVFLGYQAGYNELTSNKLYIDNSNTASPLIYGDFATDRVAIGANNPSHKLYINGGPTWTTNTWTGSVQLNTASAIGWNSNGTYAYGMGNTTNGFYVWNTTDALGTVAAPATYRMIIHNNGYTAIGANLGGAYVPTAPLHVDGFSNSGVGNFAFYAYNGAVNTGISNGLTDISIYATNRIRASEFNAFSDARIKNIHSLSIQAKDLETLMQIEVTNYSHKDIAAKGNNFKKGFIAQQIETVFPEAVTKSIDFIPNIYAKAATVVMTHDEVVISMENNHDLQVGDKVRLITDNAKQDVLVKSIVDSKTFTFKKIEGLTEHVFVYGKEVPDFRAVDYDRIFTLNVSATQALLKRVEVLEKENHELQQDKEETEAAIQSLIQRVNNLEGNNVIFTDKN